MYVREREDMTHAEEGGCKGTEREEGAEGGGVYIEREVVVMD